MNARTTLGFDLTEATTWLAGRDERLKELIGATQGFQLVLDDARSPYEALLQSIAYQSISGKAAATIFARVCALGTNGIPSPQEMLALRTATLRKAGLSGAKILAVKDLARKTIAGVVPTLQEARTMSDEELVERLTSVRGIGVWSDRDSADAVNSDPQFAEFNDKITPLLAGPSERVELKLLHAYAK